MEFDPKNTKYQENISKFTFKIEVVVAQWAGQFILTSEVHGSYPVIDNFEQILTTKATLLGANLV